MGEIYYNCWKEWGEKRAEEVLNLLDAHPIQVLHPSIEDVLAAARIKAQYRLSCADAFAIVLTQEYGGAVLTGDPDFIPLGRSGVVRVQWMCR